MDPNLTHTSYLNRLSRRDPESWRLFPERYQRIIARAVRRITRADDVEDVVQDVFLTAYKKISAFTHTGPRTFRAWLTTIARHNIIDRSRKKRPIGTGDPEIQESLPKIVARAPDCPYFDNKEFLAVLFARAREEFADRPHWVDICLQLHVEGLNAKDIANRYGISRSRVCATASIVIGWLNRLGTDLT